MVEANPSPSSNSKASKKQSGEKPGNAAAAQENSPNVQHRGSDSGSVTSPVGSQHSGNGRGSLARSGADNHDHLRIERDQEYMS